MGFKLKSVSYMCLSFVALVSPFYFRFEFRDYLTYW